MKSIDHRVLTMLGFAQKAGKVFSGDTTVEAKINRKGAALLLVAADAPGTTKEKMKRLADQKKIPMEIFGEKHDLGIAIGKSPRNAVLVMDAGFAETLMKYLKS